jgi:hypothetical protein
MSFTTLQQLLDEGNYIFGFWVQNSNNSGGNIGFASVNVKDHVTSTIYASISNINPVASYPNWLFFSIPFSLSIDANIEFEFITTSSSHQFGGYINLVGLQLTRNSAMVINDQTSGKTATLGANQSILNNVFIREGLKVQSGGVQATGGLTTNTTFGTNNLAINSSMASTSGATSSVNNLAIGANALNGLTTGSSNIAIGNGAFTAGTTNVRCISLGHTTNMLPTRTGAICIGNNNSNRGNFSVVLGDNAQTTANGGVIGDFCVAVGGDSIGCTVFNGFGALSSTHSVGIGYKALTNCADDFNTSVGSLSFVNMNGRSGVTANGNSGAITQFNSALGYNAGNLRNLYNKCTFIGAGADATMNNLTNATAIGYNCRVDASNTIQIGSNGERVIISGDLSGVTTINGVPYSAGGGESLAQTLAISNSAGTYDIDMNNNDILNVSNINLVNINGVPYSAGGGESLAQTLAISNSAGTYDIDMNNNDILNVSNINLVNINGVPYSAGGGESLAQTLAISNSAGTYDIDMNNNDILNVSNINLTNINGSPYSAGITLAQVQANANVFSSLQTLQSGFFNYKIFLSLTGGQTNYINDTSVFGRLIVCIANTSIGSFISLPNVSISNGADISVLNSSNTLFGLSSGATFLGKFGNRNLLFDILPGVCVKLYCDGTNWNIYEYSGLAQQAVYRNTGSLLVTSGGINTPSFPTFNNISWQSSRLTQSPAGVFVNNTGYDLTLAVSYTMTWNNKVNSTNNTTGSNSNGIRSSWILHSDTTTYPKFLGTNNLGTRSTTDTTGTQANIFFTTLQYQTVVSNFILKNGANFRPQIFQTNNVISGGTGVYLISTSQLDAIALTITILP